MVLRDGTARQRTYLVPSNWTGDLQLGQPGNGVLDLTTLNGQAGFGSTAMAVQDLGFDPRTVDRIEVHLDGSGAIDDLTFAPAGMVRASVTSRNGNGTNPEILTALSRPVLGLPWNARLDCASYGNGVATLTLRSRACAGSLTPHGELLLTGPRVFGESRSIARQASGFTLDIPFDVSLLGVALHAQGACRTPVQPRGKIACLRGTFSNALDLVIGL